VKKKEYESLKEGLFARYDKIIKTVKKGSDRYQTLIWNLYAKLWWLGKDYRGET